MPQPLNQVEIDLGKYTQEKVFKLILDVIQSFDIARQSKSAAVGCVGATFLRTAATLAVSTNAGRERWLAMCNEVYDRAQQAKKEDPDD